MKKIFLFLTIGASIYLNAQRNIEDYFPKTPDAAAISKSIDIPPGNYSGTASFTIPLYEVDFEGHKVPFSISYHASGIKLAEIASRVGLGWALNLGGISLSGQIVGVKDGAYRISFPENFDPGSNWEDENLAKELLDIDGNSPFARATDIKPDIFTYSTLTSQGEFIMDSSGQFGIPRPYNQDKITNSGHIIKDAQGFEYTFSDSGEILAFSNCTPPGEINPSIYNFEPAKIKSPNGQEINYYSEYANSKRVINSKYFTSLTYNKVVQELNLGFTDSLEINTLPMPEKCYNYNLQNEILTNRIEFPGGKIYLIYNDKNEEIRKDLPSDYFLKKFVVVNNLGDTIRDYSFHYEYFEANNPIPNPVSYERGTDYRLKLKRVNNELENTEYIFTYYKEDSELPNRMSSSFDFWGVYNGKDNTKVTKKEKETSIPSTIYHNLESTTPTRFYKGADRNPDFDYGIIGNLKEIKYPTGGKTRITYEPDEFEIESYTEPVYKYMRNGEAINTNGMQTEKAWEFTIDHHNYDFEVRFYSDSNPKTEITPAKIGDCTFKMYKDNNYDYNYEELVFDYDTYNPDTWFSPYYNTIEPGQYKLVITAGYDAVTEEIYHCIGEVNWYDQILLDDSNTRKAGTLRVSKIEQIDENQSKVIREFTYYNPAYPQNEEDGKTSGKNIGDQYFTSIAVTEFPRNLIGGTKQRLFLTSNPGWNLSTMGGKAIGYSNVQEIYTTADGERFRKEYTYYNETENSYNDVVPYNFIQFSFPGKDFKRGILLKEEHFRENNQSKDLVYRKVQEEPELNPYFNHLATTYSPNSPTLLLWGYEIYLRSISCVPLGCHFDFNYHPFNINNYWVQPKYSYTEEFFDNQNVILTENSTEFSSNPPKHVFPVQQSTTNSLGETIRSEYEYPQDRPNDTNMNLMIAANKISDPIVTRTYVNNQKTMESLMKYGVNLLPAVAYSKKGTGTINPNTADDLKITYDSYDTKGNLLQYTLANGTPVSIIWGYEGQYPIAKVEGKNYTEIASEFNIFSLQNASIDGSINADSFEGLRNIEGAMVTGYIYKPLVGVTQIIHPNGQVANYEYDGAGRLQQVKDQDGKILKEVEYHYQPQ